MKRRKYFTLLEILLALSIAGMVMMACSSMLFSMVSLASKMENAEPLGKHMNSVERFLKSCFINSNFPEDTPSDLFGDLRSDDGAIRLGQHPDNSSSTKMNLAFGVIKDHPFFPSSNLFSTEKLCWLDFREKEGLYLVWTFIYLEEEQSDYITYENLISKNVVGLKYWYYSDSYEWEVEEELSSSSSNAGNIPHFLEVVFKDGSEEVSRIISLFSFEEVETQTTTNSTDYGGRTGVTQAQ